MLAALGYGFEDETLRAAVDGWQGFTIDEGDRLRPEACQSPVWDTALAVLALLDAGLARASRAAPRRRLAGRARRSRSPGTGRSASPTLRRAAGPSSSRTTSTRTSTTRPLSPWRYAARPWRTRRRPRPCLDGRDAVAQRRLGRLRRRQRSLLALQAAVLRLRQGHRRAERGRHRPRVGGAGGGPATRPRSSAASSGCSPSRNRTAPGSGAGASITSTAPPPRSPLSRLAASRPITPRCDGRSPGFRRCRTRTGASGGHSLLCRPAPARPWAPDAFADRLGTIRLRGCRRG